MSPRVISIPLSGGDRKYYARQLKAAEKEHERLLRRLADADIIVADHVRMRDRIACEEWHTRQFIGGPVDPSPSIAAAVNADCIFLHVSCHACAHSQTINLEEVVWPRSRPIHSLSKALVCRSCRSKRSNLTGLTAREPDETQPKRIGKRR